MDNKISILAETQNNKNKLNSILSNYNSLGEPTKLLVRNAIPREISEEEVIYDLNKIINETGVTANKTTFSISEFEELEDGAMQDNLKEVGIGVTFTGDYFQLKKALYLIENMNRLVKVSDMNFSLDEQGTLTMQLGLVAFYENGELNLELSNENSYLIELLRSGINTDFISKYEEYRGNGHTFEFFNSENGVGRDNLFEAVLSVDNEDTSVLGEESSL